jgi:hypothetical protein
MTLGYVETMLGRRRQLPGAMDRAERSLRRGHALRAAINTPIQVAEMPLYILRGLVLRCRRLTAHMAMQQCS